MHFRKLSYFNLSLSSDKNFAGSLARNEKRINYFCSHDSSQQDAQVEDLLTQMSTEELLRMLELLDMLETKAPIQATERELALLQYLLKNYQN